MFGQVVDTICPNNPVGNYNVIGFPNSTYNWKVNGGQITDNKGDTIQVLWDLNSSIHTISVFEISENGCVGDTISGQIIIASPPNAQILGPDSACVEDRVYLEASLAQTYLWNSGETSKMVSFLLKNDTIVSVVIDNGCAKDSTTHFIKALPKPIADFSLKPEYPKTNELTYINFTGSDGYNFDWIINGDSIFINSADISHKFKNKGDNIVHLYVENKYQCFDTISKYIVVKDLLVNTFTPNNDGVNDYWELNDLVNYPNCQVWVFDKWNGEIFYSKSYTIPWDGTHKGKDVPAGSYYYVIDYGDGSEIEKGVITIIR